MPGFIKRCTCRSSASASGFYCHGARWKSHTAPGSKLKVKQSHGPWFFASPSFLVSLLLSPSITSCLWLSSTYQAASTLLNFIQCRPPPDHLQPATLLQEPQPPRYLVKLVSNGHRQVSELCIQGPKEVCKESCRSRVAHFPNASKVKVLTLQKNVPRG